LLPVPVRLTATPAVALSADEARAMLLAEALMT